MVISIVALLIGILTPAITKARMVARKSVCATRLSQIGVALTGYRGQSKDVFPTARYMPKPFLSIDTDPPLTEFLDSYVDGVRKVFQCPGDNGYVFALCGSSYVYNTSLSGKKVDEVWFVQRANIPVSEVPVSYDFDGQTYATMDSFVTVPWFHTRRNLLFADGHVGNFQ